MLQLLSLEEPRAKSLSEEWCLPSLISRRWLLVMSFQGNLSRRLRGSQIPESLPHLSSCDGQSYKPDNFPLKSPEMPCCRMGDSADQDTWTPVACVSRSVETVFLSSLSLGEVLPLQAKVLSVYRWHGRAPLRWTPIQ